MEQLPTTDQRRNSTLHDPTSDGSGQWKGKVQDIKRQKEKEELGVGGVGVVWGGGNCLLVTWKGVYP